MISLHRLARAELHRLAGLRIAPGQQDFVEDGDRMIRDQTPELSFHEVRRDGGPVGMFKLDPLYFQRHDFAAPDQIGMRGVLIDAQHQGQGLGHAMLTALPAHVRAEYPDAQQIVLTVNSRNTRAHAAYLAAGFRDEGDVWQGGGHGPQHILRLDLKQEAVDGP